MKSGLATGDTGGDDIAIVGMACVFPGAPDLATYWDNLLAGKCALGDPPPDWGAERVLDGSAAANEAVPNDRVYVTRGGWLGDLSRFDPIRHGVMPNAVAGGEPDQFLALAIAEAALEDAGPGVRSVDREKVSVILGRGTYVNRGIANVMQHGVVVDNVLDIVHSLQPFVDDAARSRMKAAIKAALPPFNADTAAGLVPNIIASRIANRMDFRGDACILDAACASSLLAVQRGMQDLRAGRCDMALVGGVHASTPAPIAMIFCQLGALSRRGALLPFDGGADGTLLGEGCGMLVLRRRADAERDGARIYALLKGVGVASDGRALGLLAPRAEGQVLAMRRALDDARIPPHTIGLIETHGTGTPVGDRTEVESLCKVYGDRQGVPACALGAVKALIGHLMPAAGAAGLIKAALALHHRVLPTEATGPDPLPELSGAGAPFRRDSIARPWIHGHLAPRRAAVSAFGFGGINAHMVLEAHAVEAAGGQRRWPSELVVLSAADRASLVRSAEELARILDHRPELALGDVARTFGIPRPDRLHLAVVAFSTGDLSAKLTRAVSELRDPGCSRLQLPEGIYFQAEPLGPSAAIAFLFPGEGAQQPGMLSELCFQFPSVRRWFDIIEAACTPDPGGAWPSEMIFPPPDDDQEAARARLAESSIASASIFAASQGLREVFGAVGLTPSSAVGHSTGEYAALLAAGANPVEDPTVLAADIKALADLFRTMEHRGELCASTMLAVTGARRAELRKVLDASPGLCVAMDNCPKQFVLCGADPLIAAASEALREEGAICLRLPIRWAYHTPAFHAFRDRYLAFLAARPMAAPQIPLWSCAAAAPFHGGPDEVRQVAAGQWTTTVRFRETVGAMYAAGTRIFVECGPGGTLSAFVGDILRGRPHLAVAPDPPGRGGVTGLLHCLAALAANGVRLSLDRLHLGRGTQEIDLGARPEASVSTPSLATSLPFLHLPLREAPPPAWPVVPAPRQTPSVAPVDTAMQAYLSTMNSFLTVQREVLAAALAAPGPAATPVAAPPPLLGAVQTLHVGRSLVAVRQIDSTTDLYIRDHTIGRGVATADPGLSGLPLVPFTFTIEMMAEAASALAPGMVVRELRGVSAHRWIALAHGPTTVEQHAAFAPADGAGRVQASIHERQEASAAPGRVLAEATVCLGSPWPDTPDQSAHAAQHAELPADFYGPQMFHGPLLQGVAGVFGHDETGIEVLLRSLPRDSLCSTEAAPRFILDPVLLDAAGQGLGYWAGVRLDAIIFPFRLDRLVLHGPPPAPGVPIRCSIRLTRIDELMLACDMELKLPDGRVLLQALGWHARRFTLPAAFRRLRVAPADTWLCEDCTAEVRKVGENTAISACRLELFDEEFLTSSGGIWESVLAHLTLTARERLVWTGFVQPELRRSWLRRSCVAKDAIRRVLRTSGLPPLAPADIDLFENSNELSVRLPRWLGVPDELHVALSCENGRWVAVAAKGPNSAAQVRAGHRPGSTATKAAEGSTE